MNDLEKLYWLAFPHKYSESANVDEKQKVVEELSNKLKALKIIIEKKVNMALLIIFMEKDKDEDDEYTCDKYNRWWEYPLTLDEYKLIKEIINDYK